MTFKEPTYEEYKSATTFAKFKYKYRTIVLILCWLCLLFLCYYMVVRGEALAKNPLAYGAEKFNVECYCYNYERQTQFYVNGSTIWTSGSLEKPLEYSEEWELKK